MIKRVLLLFCMGCLTTGVFGQSGKTNADTLNAYGGGYKRPHFPGGSGDLDDYLAKNLHYPDAARDNNIEGLVEVQFMVSEKGEISRVKVVRSLFPSLDSEVMRIVGYMPAWRPATYRHHAVRAVERLPVAFSLE